jgi:hypothetical protein
VKSQLALALNSARVRIGAALAVPVRVALHVARLSGLDAPPPEQARMIRIAVVDRVLPAESAHARMHVVLPLRLGIMAGGACRVLDVAVVTRLASGSECEKEREDECDEDEVADEHHCSTLKWFEFFSVYTFGFLKLPLPIQISIVEIQINAAQATA